jgi:hypothetical protein
LMGLPDRYDKNERPLPNYRGNIMADINGRPNGQDIANTVRSCPRP